MKIYNDFGITPTRNHSAAGYDFYVPNIDDTNTEQVRRFQSALSKSYGVDNPAIILQGIYAWLRNVKNLSLETPVYNLNNILHLYLAINHNNRLQVISDFCDRYIIFDNNGHVGARLFPGDTLLINSGIKQAINHGYAGVFMNKSGRGARGFDVRAQVIDEDYMGHVHLSLQYLGKDREQGIVYCGDKIVQQLVIPVLGDIVEELTADEYSDVMSGSSRGNKGFGSSDENHSDTSNVATPVKVSDMKDTAPVKDEAPVKSTDTKDVNPVKVSDMKEPEQSPGVEEAKPKPTRGTQKKTKQ